MKRWLRIGVLLAAALPVMAIDPIPTCDPCLDCLMYCIPAWPFQGCVSIGC